ncbi:uncharacterized protein VTP21DRAFT_7242 [Calcarisporiella thermophila]|uniref:uncharacterized protein n=1 Tax=Calcarisporiella thermophila TaxID=911321 RepID=UPI003742A15E
MQRKTLLFLALLLFGSESLASPVRRDDAASPQEGPRWSCLEYIDPLDQRKKKVWPCSAIEAEMEGVESLEKRQERADTQESQFKINFKCRAGNQALCNKAQADFELAGKLLSDSLVLKKPITVDAEFFSFCREIDGNCARPNNILGFAAPARMFPMKDVDGEVRMFPQSLVKQMTDKADFAKDDITARFNSDFPYRFAQDGENAPRVRGQTDFLELIMHEMTHGLGFLSLWGDEVAPGASRLLTPMLNLRIQKDGSAIFTGFSESAFDRFMATFPDGSSMTEQTKQLNQFNNGKPFNAKTPLELAQAVDQSPQGKIARAMMAKATQFKGMGFVPAGKQASDAFFLETSLNPFVQGSSVSHVDQRTHQRNADRLMIFESDPNISFVQSIQRFGGPVGPELLSVFKSIGYSVREVSSEQVLGEIRGAASNRAASNQVAGSQGVRKSPKARAKAAAELAEKLTAKAKEEVARAKEDTGARSREAAAPKAAEETPTKSKEEEATVPANEEATAPKPKKKKNGRVRKPKRKKKAAKLQKAKAGREPEAAKTA